MNASKSRESLLAIAALVLLGAGGVALSALWREAIAIGALARALAGWREAAPLAFIALHVVATVLFVPRLVMGRAAGVQFGPWLGAAWGLAGVVLGAASAFMLARFVAPDFAARLGRTRAAPALRKLRASGWRAVFVMRLIPVLPHALVNYGLGMARISLAGYAGGTALGLAPTAIVYAQLGAAGHLALDDPASWTALAIWSAAAAALAAAAVLLRRMANAGRITEGT